MEELEIRKRFKEKYNYLTEKELNILFELMKKNDTLPKNNKELLELFFAIDTAPKAWDESEDPDNLDNDNY